MTHAFFTFKPRFIHVTCNSKFVFFDQNCQWAIIEFDIREQINFLDEVGSIGKKNTASLHPLVSRLVSLLYHLGQKELIVSETKEKQVLLLYKLHSIIYRCYH